MNERFTKINTYTFSQVFKWIQKSECCSLPLTLMFSFCKDFWNLLITTKDCFSHIKFNLCNRIWWLSSEYLNKRIFTSSKNAWKNAGNWYLSENLAITYRYSLYKKREITFIWNIYFGNKTRKRSINEVENKSIRVPENSFSAGTYISCTNVFQTLYQSCWKTFSKQLWEELSVTPLVKYLALFFKTVTG